MRLLDFLFRLKDKDTQQVSVEAIEKANTTDANLEIAYWTIVKELEPASTIPVALLESVRPKFMARSGDPRAGDLFYNHLQGIDWDWPAWHDFSAAIGEDNLVSIVSAVATMSTEDVLMSLTVPELKQQCANAGIPTTTKSKKKEIIASFVEVCSEELISTVRSSIYQKKVEKCRKEMAKRLGWEIERLSYNLMRYEQLEYLPYWAFHWVEDTEAEKTNSCRQFHGQILPAEVAKETFPVLPCKRFQCDCHISGTHNPDRIKRFFDE